MRLRITIQFEWIKGHQNSTDNPLDQFSIELNTQADSLATDIYKSDLRQVCFHQEGFHVQDIANAISSRESDQHMLDYYRSKGWTEKVAQ